MLHIGKSGGDYHSLPLRKNKGGINHHPFAVALSATIQRSRDSAAIAASLAAIAAPDGNRKLQKVEYESASSQRARRVAAKVRT